MRFFLVLVIFTGLPVMLMADVHDAADGLAQVRGESRIPKATGDIERVYLEPDDAPAYPGAVRALLDSVGNRGAGYRAARLV